MADLDSEAAVERGEEPRRGFLRPLDEDNCIRIVFVGWQKVKGIVARFQPVEIEMQRSPRTGIVIIAQVECRRSHRVYTPGLEYRCDQGGFARPQIAVEQYQQGSNQSFAQFTGYRLKAGKVVSLYRH